MRSCGGNIMIEYLNEQERQMLCYLGRRYQKHYDPIIRMPEHDFEIIDDDPVDMVQNILQALRLRGYITADPLIFDLRTELRTVYLTEKALNLFNSDDFAEW